MENFNCEIKSELHFKRYIKLIEYAQTCQLSEDYVERHHIVPKSMGGSNKKSNIITL
jgi:hypothetical protein